MALECVEGADVAGMSDERGRRACGAAGFVRAGRRPDPARLLRRDRFSSASRSVRRGRARLPGSRDGHLCTRPAFPRESTGPSSDSRRNVEFDVPRRCASGAVPPRTQDRAPRSTPAMSHCAVSPRTRDRARSWPRRRRRTRTGMLMSAGLPAADPEGGGGHARNARVGQTTSAGGTTPPPTGSSPGARAASLCSTAPGLRNTFSLIVNIPDRRRPARRQRSRDEGPRVGTDLEPELNRSRRGIRPISAKGRVGEAKERGRGETPAEHPGRLWADSPSDLPAPRRSRRNSRAPLPWEGD